MKIKFKRNGNGVLGATLDCSPVEMITISKALKTQLSIAKAEQACFGETKRDIKLIEKMLADIRGEEG